MTEEKKNLWDELWEDINWDRVTTIPFITERIHKIRAEGDRLKEKLEDVKIHFNLVEKYRNNADDLPDNHAYRHIINSLWFTAFREILDDVNIDEKHI